MSLSFYLYFKGECKVAFEHYKTVFLAEEICCQRYSEGPKEMFGNEPADWVMHTTIKIGETMLMGSDRPESCDEVIQKGNNFCISYRPNDQRHADETFQKLAAGGKIDMPLQNTFWGSYFGTCTDKFGVHWMFNLPLA